MFPKIFRLICKQQYSGSKQNSNQNWPFKSSYRYFTNFIQHPGFALQIFIDKLEKVWIRSEEIPSSVVLSVKLKKKRAGAVVLEVIFTLPLVFYMVFFCVELIRINITNDALQTICEEATFLTSAHNYESGPELIAKIDAIIEKHRPRFIPQNAPGYTNEAKPVIRWSFVTASSAKECLSSDPYGGYSPVYQGYELYPRYGESHSTFVYAKRSQFVPILGKRSGANFQNHEVCVNHMQNAGLPDGRFFVLDVICNYPFSNSLVKILFNGGVNTKINDVNWNEAGTKDASANKIGTMYLLYARGAGVVGKKK